jgi:hypothetical protein
MPDSVHENPNHPHLAVVCVQIMTFRLNNPVSRRTSRPVERLGAKALILCNVFHIGRRILAESRLSARKNEKAGKAPASRFSQERCC